MYISDYKSSFANHTHTSLEVYSSDDDDLRPVPAPCSHGEQIAIFVFFSLACTFPVLCCLATKRASSRSFALFSFPCYLSQFLWIAYIVVMQKCVWKVGGLYITAFILMFLCYVVVIIETLFSEEYKILCVKDALSVSEYVDNLKASAPEVVYRVICYHYRGAIRRVNTFVREERFPVGNWYDVSDPFNKSSKFTLLTLTIKTIFGNNETESELERRKHDLGIEYYNRDKLTDVDWKTCIAGFKDNYFSYTDRKPFWFNKTIFIITMLCFLVWPYRLLIRLMRRKVNYVVQKVIFNESTANSTEAYSIALPDILNDQYIPEPENDYNTQVVESYVSPSFEYDEISIPEPASPISDDPPSYDVIQPPPSYDEALNYPQPPHPPGESSDESERDIQTQQQDDQQLRSTETAQSSAQEQENQTELDRQPSLTQPNQRRAPSTPNVDELEQSNHTQLNQQLSSTQEIHRSAPSAPNVNQLEEGNQTQINQQLSSTQELQLSAQSDERRVSFI